MQIPCDPTGGVVDVWPVWPGRWGRAGWLWSLAVPYVDLAVAVGAVPAITRNLSELAESQATAGLLVDSQGPAVRLRFENDASLLLLSSVAVPLEAVSLFGDEGRACSGAGGLHTFGLWREAAEPVITSSLSEQAHKTASSGGGSLVNLHIRLQLEAFDRPSPCLLQREDLPRRHGSTATSNLSQTALQITGNGRSLLRLREVRVLHPVGRCVTRRWRLELAPALSRGGDCTHKQSVRQQTSRIQAVDWYIVLTVVALRWVVLFLVDC